MQIGNNIYIDIAVETLRVAAINAYNNRDSVTHIRAAQEATDKIHELMKEQPLETRHIKVVIDALKMCTEVLRDKSESPNL